MATIIIRNSTGSGVTPSSLVQGELAINTVDGKLFYGSGSGNIVKEFTASNSLTASYLNTLNQNLTFNGNLTLNGTASISTLVVNQTQYSSGSNQLGDASNDTQTLYGSVIIPTGSLTVSGNVSFGTSSAGFYWDNTNGYLGIKKTNPAVEIDVVGSIRATGTVFNTTTQTQIIQVNSGVSALRFFSGSVETARYDGNNWGFYTTTPTARLQVKGSGTTSATTALRVENTNASASMVVLDNGFVGINTGSAAYNLDVNGTSRFQNHLFIGSGHAVVSLGNNVNLRSNLAGGSGYVIDAQSYNTLNSTSNEQGFGLFTGTYAPTSVSGTPSFNALKLTPTINQTGGANQITRGLYINPTLTAAADFRAIETTAGNVLFQSGSTPLLFVSSSGNIGINTTSSAYRLQIDASGSSNSSLPLALTSVDAANRVGILFASSSISAGKQHRLFHRVNGNNVEWIQGASAGETAIWRFLSRDDTNYGVNILAPFNGGTSYLNTGLSQSLFSLGAGSQTAQHINISSSGNVGIGTTTPSYRLDVSGSGNFTANLTVTGSTTLHNGQTTIQGAGATSATTALVVRNSTPTNIITVLNNNVVGINRTPTASLDVAGTTRLSGSFDTAASGSILTVIGSGSTQPIFTVQGSQGELFSITDSLTGSLFSVNDISGLPILEVFSDNTTLIGDYQDPMLITTKKVTMTNSGSFVVYSLPTASYDTAFFDYSIKSGSNARAGQIMAIQSGSSVNFTETTTTDFGSTTAVSFTVIVSGSNMVLTGSASTGSWTIKTIVRGL